MNLKHHLIPSGVCPLCKSGLFKKLIYSEPFANSYSDILCHKFNINLNDLFSHLNPSKCSSCGLIFFQNWFDLSIRNWLYTQRVPSHPSGWKVFMRDAICSNQSLDDAVFNYNSTKSPRYQRELLELLSSYLEDVPLKAHLLRQVTNNKSIAINAKDLALDFSKPAPFSKYSMFQNKYIERIILRLLGDDLEILSTSRYAEFGCPFWGILEANSQRYDCYHIPASRDFWGSHCVKPSSLDTDKVSCTHSLNSVTSLCQDQIDSLENNYFKVLSCFAIIDHFPDLNWLLSSLLRVTKHLVILNEYSDDDANSPPPVQHICNLSYKSLEWFFSGKLDYSLETYTLPHSKYSHVTVISKK